MYSAKTRQQILLKDRVLSLLVALDGGQTSSLTEDEVIEVFTSIADNHKDKSTNALMTALSAYYEA